MPAAISAADNKHTPPRISITVIDDFGEASSALLTETDQTLQDIRRRAYAYFQRRGERLGQEWDDWLRAESELLWKPSAEMFENAFTIVLRVAVPGFDAGSIRVMATPHVILVRASETHRHYGLEDRLRFCEFGEHLFRRFELPARTDPNTASATLYKGILEIVADVARPVRKAAPEEAVQATAAS